MKFDLCYVGINRHRPAWILLLVKYSSVIFRFIIPVVFYASEGRIRISQTCNNKPPGLHASLHPPHTQPATTSATTPLKTAPSKRTKDSIHTQPHNVHFFATPIISTQKVCPAHWTTQGKPLKSRTLQDWPTRKRRPKAVQPAPEHEISHHNTPKRAQPGTPQILSVSFYVHLDFQWRF
jgi:hypothetical protein